MRIDVSDMPPLPVLSKPDRRKDCGACGTDIRGDRKARSSGLCWTCRKSIEHRGRPLVPFAECECDCEWHPKGNFSCVDDGKCGGPPGHGHTRCCFQGEDGGDPEFRKLFEPHHQEFNRRVEAARAEARRVREERWARKEYFPGEVIAEPRASMTPNWTPQAVEDMKKLWDDSRSRPKTVFYDTEDDDG